MELTHIDINRLADLAHLSLTEAEQQQFSCQLTDLLSFFDGMTHVTNADPILPQITISADSLRSDEPAEGICRENMLANASTRADGCITVPLVMEDV